MDPLITLNTSRSIHTILLIGQAQSAMETPHRSAHPSASHARSYWESKLPGGPTYPCSSPPQAPPHEGGHLYDPTRVDARERPVEEARRYPGSMATSPEMPSCVPRHTGSGPLEPSPGTDSKSRRKPQQVGEKDSDTQCVPTNATSTRRPESLTKIMTRVPQMPCCSFAVPFR